METIKMTIRNIARNRSIALAVAAALSTAVAQAQTVDALDEVAVTASRIQRTGFEAPTPTTYLGADEIENRAAVRISQVLFELPAMRPTATAVPWQMN
jgi:outer membrane cobalamin receptor